MMGMSTFSRTTTVTTTSANYELLQDENVKRVLKYAYGFLRGFSPTTAELTRAETAYQRMLSENGFGKIYISILSSTATRLSVNNEPYENQTGTRSISHDISLGEYVRIGINSIRVEDDDTTLEITINSL